MIDQIVQDILMGWVIGCVLSFMIPIFYKGRIGQKM